MITDDEAKQFLDTLKKICKAEPNKQLQQVNLNLGKNSEYGIEEIYLYNETKKERYTENLLIKNCNIDYYVRKYYENNGKISDNDLVIALLGLPIDEIEKLSKTNQIAEEYKNSFIDVDDDGKPKNNFTEKASYTTND